jgi:polyribonucleotide nucleotidyltransferase
MEVLPGKDGLIHISEISDRRVERVEDVLKVGEIVSAKCVGVDEKGRIKMSRKALLGKGAPAKAPAAPAIEDVEI